LLEETEGTIAKTFATGRSIHASRMQIRRSGSSVQRTSKTSSQFVNNKALQCGGETMSGRPKILYRG
jgi:hypothetical protein